MEGGADGQTGAPAAPCAGLASGDGTGVATIPGRPMAVIHAMATTSIMTYAWAPIVMVRLYYCYYLIHAFTCTALVLITGYTKQPSTQLVKNLFTS